jgi:hypothetical protein
MMRDLLRGQSYISYWSHLKGAPQTLERQNRGLKGIVIMAVIALCAIFLLEQPRPSQAKAADRETVEAGKFVLRDEDGNKRATLAFDGFASAPALTLYATDGSKRVTIDAGKTEPTLTLWKSDKALTYLATGQIVLTDERTNAHMNLTWKQIEFRDEDNDIRFSKP